ncbi:Uncharacterised protein [Mycobacterium tuberculosis]|nr:Uncharacterised protein [Mycobacterium tuberculosis]
MQIIGGDSHPCVRHLNPDPLLLCYRRQANLAFFSELQGVLHQVLQYLCHSIAVSVDFRQFPLYIDLQRNALFFGLRMKGERNFIQQIADIYRELGECDLIVFQLHQIHQIIDQTIDLHRL